MTNVQGFDISQGFQIEGQDIRGRLVRIGPVVDEALKGHDYPPEVADMLAETLTLGATLASTLKYDGLFTLQVQSDGPISVLVADLTTNGGVRGYARYDAARVADAAKLQGAKVPRLLGNGHLAFTVDQGPDMERYQGVVALEGGTLAACAQTYFRTSEQLETIIFLGSNHDDQGYKAGALLVQRMPNKHITDSEETEENWRRIVVLLASLKLEELLDEDLSPEQILFRLYHEDGVRVFEAKPLVHKCRCSLQKVANTLKSFPREEITVEDGTAQVVCEFCIATYDFTIADLDQLYDE